MPLLALVLPFVLVPGAGTAVATVPGVRISAAVPTVLHLTASGVPASSTVAAGAIVLFQNDDSIARSVASTTPNWSFTVNLIEPGGSFMVPEALTGPGVYRFTSRDRPVGPANADGSVIVAGATGTTSAGPPGQQPAGGARRGGPLSQPSSGREYGLPAVLALTLIIGLASMLGRLLRPAARRREQ